MAGETPQEDGNQAGGSIFDVLKKILLMFLVANTVSNFMKPKSPETEAVITNSDGNATVALTPTPLNSTFLKIEKPVNPFNLVDVTDDEGNVVSQRNVSSLEQLVYENSLIPATFLSPIWKEGDYAIDLKFYVDDQRVASDSGELLFELSNVTIDKVNDVTKHFVLKVPDNVKFNNGSLYLHTFISRDGYPEVGQKTVQLNTFFPKKRVVKLHKLIGSEEEANGASDVENALDYETPQEQPIVAYWHPNVTISLVKTRGLVDARTLPPPLLDIFPLDPLDLRDNSTGRVTQYFPLVYQNKFWQLRSHMSEINATTDELELNLNIDFASFWKVQVLVLFSDGMEQQKNNPMSVTDGSELDAIKRILLDTNPYLLAITIAVSILHSVLEFLAFKNDISHWRNKKNNVGISVRSIVANVIQQTITLLYLIDNSDGTSYMILASQGFGILVEAWKITTIVNIDIQWDGLIPRVSITDKYQLSETEQKTKEYDSIAFKYLYWVASPLLVAYAVYSLMYKEHKSWYSFIVTTLVGFVYTYGFLTLVPSVYINYRLKSVAHVPKKAMAYKVVNTFIDDLFAFVVKMPWLHRLATLRDDVIFFIYLYQTWIYRVDYSRVNEFGQGGEEEESIIEKDSNGNKTTKKETKKQK